jgi:hypothetical protein
VGQGVFKDCRGLRSLAIPRSITTISREMFYYCYSLAYIFLPNTVTSIGSDSFNGCQSLTNYFIDCDIVPTLSNTNAFSGINASAIFWVNDSIIEQLKVATNWSTYASYMKPRSWYPSLTDPNA